MTSSPSAPGSRPSPGAEPRNFGPHRLRRAGRGAPGILRRMDLRRVVRHSAHPRGPDGKPGAFPAGHAATLWRRRAPQARQACRAKVAGGGLPDAGCPADFPRWLVRPIFPAGLPIRRFISDCPMTLRRDVDCRFFRTMFARHAVISSGSARPSLMDETGRVSWLRPRSETDGQAPVASGRVTPAPPVRPGHLRRTASRKERRCHFAVLPFGATLFRGTGGRCGKTDRAMP